MAAIVHGFITKFTKVTKVTKENTKELVIFFGVFVICVIFVVPFVVSA